MLISPQQTTVQYGAECGTHSAAVLGTHGKKAWWLVSGEVYITTCAGIDANQYQHRAEH